MILVEEDGWVVGSTAADSVARTVVCEETAERFCTAAPHSLQNPRESVNVAPQLLQIIIDVLSNDVST